MWVRQLFLVCFFVLTILTTQSHVIHKRGLLSKLFGGSSKSTQNVNANVSPREQSKLRELLKNPVVITMLSAAVGMVVQQALAAKNMNDICDNKYVKMAYMAGSMNPQIYQALTMLGCNGPNRKYGNKDNNNNNNKYGSSTTAGYNNNNNGQDNDNEEEQSDDQDDNKDEDDDAVQSSLPPEKESKIQQLLSISRGEKGAKRNFIKGLFGLNSKKSFKQGHKLPSSSYKLDKDDANSMKDLEKEIDQYNKVIN